jgi:hypothetical protein
VPIILSRGGGGLLRRRGFTRVHEVVAGKTLELAGAEVTAVAGASRVYLAGDTDLHARASRSWSPRLEDPHVGVRAPLQDTRRPYCPPTEVHGDWSLPIHTKEDAA